MTERIWEASYLGSCYIICLQTAHSWQNVVGNTGVHHKHLDTFCTGTWNFRLGKIVKKFIQLASKSTGQLWKVLSCTERRGYFTFVTNHFRNAPTFQKLLVSGSECQTFVAMLEKLGKSEPIYWVSEKKVTPQGEIRIGFWISLIYCFGRELARPWPVSRGDWIPKHPLSSIITHYDSMMVMRLFFYGYNIKSESMMTKW